MVPPRLVLASASPRRLDVLRQLALAPSVRPADVDESYLEGERPQEHVERLARSKARVVAEMEPEALVIGGDTVVVDGERVLTKPADPEDAVSMLMGLAGRRHEVLSGIAIVGPHRTVSAVARTEVRMRPFGEDVARAYVETGEPMDKAGAYGIQGLGAALVESLEGDYYAVVGFPVAEFLGLLEQMGWRYVSGTLVATATD
jgi:septum formation protein